MRISKDALLHNLGVFRRRTPGWLCAPVLKSNAYGHGLLEVARILEEQEGVAFFVVDSYFEARVVRTAGIETPVLVIGHTPMETMLRCPFGAVAFTIGSIRELKEAARRKVRASLHLKIDTGMRRQGIQIAELTEAVELTQKSGLRIEGFCSHLADSDGDADAFTRTQIERWNTAANEWKRGSPSTRWYHLANTSGTRYAELIDANVFRLGLGLYGLECSKSVPDIRGALSMHTMVTALRRVPAGEPVGYNCTFTTTRPTVIATIPAGYFEGIDRRLSNRGIVRVRGKECLIIGRVSMNMTTIDVTDLSDADLGEEAEIISADVSCKNSVAAIAATCETIPYEILVHLPAHLKRVITK